MTLLKIAKILPSAAALALIMVSVPTVAQTASSPQDSAAANFRMADADADGFLSFDEFGVFINLNAAQNIGQANRVKSAGAYERAFARLDQDRDGLVSPDELANAGN